jgi:hypothetical protein
MKKKTDQIKLLELLSQQLLFAAEKLNESDTDSGHEALIHQLGTYRQVCPDCEDQHLNDASDDGVFDFIWKIAHNEELLGLMIWCAYSHHSKQDVDNLFRRKEREFCESADEEEMHFHLTGEHYEDCDCPKCDDSRRMAEAIAEWNTEGHREGFAAAYERFRETHPGTPPDNPPASWAAPEKCVMIEESECLCDDCRKELEAAEEAA